MLCGRMTNLSRWLAGGPVGETVSKSFWVKWMITLASVGLNEKRDAELSGQGHWVKWGSR